MGLGNVEKMGKWAFPVMFIFYLLYHKKISSFASSSLSFCQECPEAQPLFSSSVPLRALNEMWKCQNLLRHHVKDLLDLVKKPKVAPPEARSE